MFVWTWVLILGGTALFVDAESGRDLRAELARCVVQKGFDLLGLQPVGMSLEEIFLHLTTAEPASTAAPAPESPEANS